MHTSANKLAYTVEATTSVWVEKSPAVGRKYVKGSRDNLRHQLQTCSDKLHITTTTATKLNSCSASSFATSHMSVVHSPQPMNGEYFSYPWTPLSVTAMNTKTEHSWLHTCILFKLVYPTVLFEPFMTELLTIFITIPLHHLYYNIGCF